MSRTPPAGMVRPHQCKDPSMPEAIVSMRRIVLLSSTLLLSGCGGSGFYAYLGNTFTLPFGANPNAAPGSGENYAKVRGSTATRSETPILYEAGDIWPPPPKPPMTLKDLQAQQTTEMKNSENGGYTPLQPLPQLPGYEVPQQQPQRAVPGPSFPAGTVTRSNGGLVGTGGGTDLKNFGPAGNGAIIVPNGNGTSTVIAPNGSVTTIPTPGK